MGVDNDYDVLDEDDVPSREVRVQDILDWRIADGRCAKPPRLDTQRPDHPDTRFFAALVMTSGRLGRFCWVAVESENREVLQIDMKIG